MSNSNENIPGEALVLDLVSRIEDRMRYVLCTVTEALNRLLDAAEPFQPPPASWAHFEQFRSDWEQLVPDKSDPQFLDRVRDTLAARYRPETREEPRSPFHLAFSATRWISVLGGEWVVQEGDAGDYVLYLISGQMAVSVPDGKPAPGGNRIQAGELVGEIELFSGEPYRAGLQATRDSELVGIPRNVIQEIADQTPKLWKRIAASAVSHLDRLVPGGRPERRAAMIVAVCRGSADVDVDRFVQRLCNALRPDGPTAIVDSRTVDEDLGAGCSQAQANDPDAGRLRAYLEGLHAANRYVILRCDDDFNGWTRRCIRQADQVILTAGSQPPDFRQFERESGVSGYHLVIGASERAVKPSNWALGAGVGLIHFADPGDERQIARLARLIGGRALGLVLGGGGARCLVQIGAIRAFQECGLEIDAVGGTSMGSCIAAQVALGLDYREMLERSAEAFRRRPSDYVFPRVSLLSGKHVNDALQRMFRDVCIEDLKRAFFAVSSDLILGETVVHRRGPVWLAVRASSSVAGVLPPVSDRGTLLVDGGVLDNLPVQVMESLAPGIRIAAVDVNPYGYQSFANVPHYGAAYGFRQILRVLNPLALKKEVPGIQAILERTTTLASVTQARALLHRMCLYIHPPTDQIGMLDMGRSEELADLGYHYTKRELTAWLEDQNGHQG